MNFVKVKRILKTVNVKKRSTIKCLEHNRYIRQIRSNKRLKKMMVLCIVIATSSTIFVYAIGSDKRQARKEEEASIAQMLSLKQGELSASQKKKELASKVQQAKVFIETISKEAEVIGASTKFDSKFKDTKNYDSALKKFLVGNAIEIVIPYDASYKINMKYVDMSVDGDGIVIINVDKKDLELILSQGDAFISNVSNKEKGIFPSDFDESYVLAALSANKESVAKQLEENEEFKNEAIEGIKEFFSSLADNWNVSLKFNDDVLMGGKVGAEK